MARIYAHFYDRMEPNQPMRREIVACVPRAGDWVKLMKLWKVHSVVYDLSVSNESETLVQVILE